MASFSVINYGDISPRVGLYAVAKFLKHATPKLFLEKFAMTQAIPPNTGQVLIWRRSLPFETATEALVEGVTPAPTGYDYEDVQSVVSEYGAWVGFSDVIQDTHEDDLLNELSMNAGEQAARTKEQILWNAMIGGTNVIYSGTATARNQVIAPLDIGDIMLATRTLKNAYAEKVTRMLDASQKIATQPVDAAYIAVGHTDLEMDIRNLPGFVSREYYSNTGNIVGEGELGKVNDVRFVLNSHYSYFAGAGGTVGSGVLTTGGKADVFPLVIFGQDAFAATPLKGRDSARIVVTNPKMGSPGDELGQRGSISWKMWYAGTRLNESYLVRLEVAASTI